MRMYLISLGLSIWNIAHVGVDFPDEDEELDFEQLQQIHHNAQACMVLLSSLEKDEFDRVNGLEKGKDIWDTLQRAQEGTKPIKKAKRQLIEGQLDRFFMLHDCHTRFLRQNKVLIVYMPRIHCSTHTDQKCSQITKCHEQSIFIK
jgi:hypothetical protein